MKAGVVHAREDIRYEEIEETSTKKRPGTDQSKIYRNLWIRCSTCQWGCMPFLPVMYWDMSSQEQ